MKKSRSGGETATLIKLVLTALCVSLLVIIALCALAAALIHAEKLPENVIPYCAWAICMLGSAAGCMTGHRLAGRARLPISLIVAALLLSALEAGKELMGNRAGGAWHCALIVLLAAVGSAFVTAGRRGARR